MNQRQKSTKTQGFSILTSWTVKDNMAFAMPK